MSEYVYFVDKNDTPTGDVSEKLAAHNSDTKLHAAFSCYVFNKRGQILVTRRASIKKVWPDVWTNTCCGHPKPKESRESAVMRRLCYELGIQVDSVHQVVSKYIYKTPPYKGIVEHEFCPIYVTRYDEDPIPNFEEVAAWEWLDWSEYISQLESDTSDYSGLVSMSSPKWSWWCKDQLKYLKNNKDFSDFLDQLK